jgi:hypothetical protein
VAEVVLGLDGDGYLATGNVMVMEKNLHTLPQNSYGTLKIQST